MPEDLLLLLLVLSCFTQLFFIFYFFIPIGEHQPSHLQQNEDYYPVSVVVCARNEEHNLKRNLDAILNQSYPQFEVLIVNDHSEDGTSSFIKSKELEYSNLRLVELKEEKGHPGKKEALKVGVEAAKHARILLTDSDCIPASPNWIHKMAEQMNEGKTLVLGYSPVRKTTGFLNALVRFDVWFIALQYLGFAMKGKPYMGTGRNMMYQKNWALNGLGQHMDLASGDDDLLVNELAQAESTSICITPESHVETFAPERWSHYFKQKQRHLTTGMRYKRQHQLLLGLLNGSKMVMYCLAIPFIFVGKSPLVPLLFLLSYWLFFVASGLKASQFLGNRRLLLLIPILDVVSVFFNSFVFVSTIFGNTTRWK
jgi:biofilm PGA synthesis N-glycosyltransferase PgaC